LGEKRYSPEDWDVDRWPHLLVCIYPLTHALPDLVRQPTFRVVQASTVQGDGTELIQIDFDNLHPLNSTGTRFCPTQGGSLLLDPNRLWTLRSCTLRNKYSDGDTIDIFGN